MSFTSGNLDACAAQIASWKPFAPAGVGVEESGLKEFGGHMARCNSAGSTCAQDALRLGMHSSGRSVSCPSLSGEAECEFSTHVEVFPLRERFVGRRDGGIEGTTHFGEICPRVTSWRRSAFRRDLVDASVSKCHSLPGDDARWDVFSTSICAFSSQQGPLQEGRKRVGSWSKRRKQMSHAFLRSLWRWKEGVHARKRRKRAAILCSCSGSGARSYTSDPSTLRASSGISKSVTGTDSSGELFFGVVGTQSRWGADFSTAFAAPSVGLRNTCVTNLRDVREGSDHPPFWSGARSDGKCAETGYNSEPGYSADSELNCADDGVVDEDDDEEEKEPVHLVVWEEMVSRKSMQVAGKPEVIEDCVVELFYGKDTRMRKLNPRLRQRRRSWRTSDLFKNRLLQSMKTLMISSQMLVLSGLSSDFGS